MIVISVAIGLFVGFVAGVHGRARMFDNGYALGRRNGYSLGWLDGKQGKRNEYPLPLPVDGVEVGR